MDPNNPSFSRYTLHPDIQLPSDHVPLVIDVGIKEENIDITIQSIKKDSKEKIAFIGSIIRKVRLINTSDLKS